MPDPTSLEIGARLAVTRMVSRTTRRAVQRTQSERWIASRAERVAAKFVMATPSGALDCLIRRFDGVSPYCFHCLVTLWRKVIPRF
jgi:hypothetical protein